MSIIGKALRAAVDEYNRQMSAANGEHDHQWVDESKFADGAVVRLACTVPGCGAVREVPRGQHL